MTKTKLSQIILKLLAITLAFTLVLLSMLAIEGIKALLNFAGFLIKLANRPTEPPTTPPTVVEVLPSELMVVAPQSIIKRPWTVTDPNAIPYAKTNLLWMVDLLPKEYLTIRELKKWAQARKIRNYGKLTKSQLILALN
jgi:hypothetical protein